MYYEKPERTPFRRALPTGKGPKNPKKSMVVETGTKRTHQGQKLKFLVYSKRHFSQKLFTSK